MAVNGRSLGFFTKKNVSGILDYPINVVAMVTWLQVSQPKRYKHDLPSPGRSLGIFTKKNVNGILNYPINVVAMVTWLQVSQPKRYKHDFASPGRSLGSFSILSHLRLGLPCKCNETMRAWLQILVSQPK